MKKYLFLAAAAMVALTSCNQQPKATTEEAAAQDQTIELEEHPTTGKLAVYYIDRVLAAYDMATEHQASFQKEYEAKDKELKSSAAAIQKEFNTLQDKVNKVLITRADAEQQAGKLQERQARLEERSNKASQELAEKEQVMTNQIYFSIYEYVNKMNVDCTYDLILATQSVTGPVISLNPALDITQQVIDGLNQQYAATKTDAPKTK